MKTEPGLPVVKTEHGGDVELDDDATLEWARANSLKMARECQCAALRRFAQRRRGRDEGGVVVIDDSDDEDAPPPPPVRHGVTGQGSSRDAPGVFKKAKYIANFGKIRRSSAKFGIYYIIVADFYYIIYLIKKEIG